jgi:hypothetical protein
VNYISSLQPIGLYLLQIGAQWLQVAGKQLNKQMSDQIKQEIAAAADRRAVWRALLGLDAQMAVLAVVDTAGKQVCRLWIQSGKHIVAAYAEFEGRTLDGNAALLAVLERKDLKYDLLAASSPQGHYHITVPIADLATDEALASALLKSAVENKTYYRSASPGSSRQNIIPTSAATPYARDAQSSHSNVMALRRWQELASSTSGKNSAVNDETSDKESRDAKVATTAQLKRKTLATKPSLALQLIPSIVVCIVLLYLCCLGMNKLCDAAATRLCSREVDIAINRGTAADFRIPKVQEKSGSGAHAWQLPFDFSK